MATVNLHNTQESVITGNDSIVIRSVTHDIPGGRTLDVTGFTPEVINAGHVIIHETATGEYKPMPMADADTYAALPVGHTYAGILVASTLTEKPFAAIMVGGQVNPTAAPNDLATILAAVKAALPLIDFRAD